MPFSRSFEATIVAVALACVRCAPSPELGQLKNQASFDMSCSNRDDIHSRARGNDVYDVDGCGKHARYLWVCDGHGPMSPCKWVREKHGPAESK